MNDQIDGRPKSLDAVHRIRATTLDAVARRAALVEAEDGPQEDALGAMLDASDELPTLVTFITGPSRTGDIELQLVIGVHGPRELHVILLDR